MTAAVCRAAANGCRDSTTAQISPPYLAPAREDGKLLVKKIVDFAILLQPNAITAAGFKNLDPLPQASSASYNQTTDNTTISKILAVNMETKASGGNINEAIMQLSIWSSAQFERLKKLAETAGKFDSMPEMPVLPCMIVQGAIWAVCAATHDSGETVCTPHSYEKHFC